jgi:hypothetical protein
MKIIRLERFRYTAVATIGRLYLPGANVSLCYTLEDTVRAWGIKVAKHTAIPATSMTFYRVAVTMSQRFGRELPIIYTHIENGIYILRAGGISFEGIRIHGGNTVMDTEGCILAGFHYDNQEKIWGSAADDVTAAIRQMLAVGHDVGLSVRNLTQ